MGRLLRAPCEKIRSREELAALWRQAPPARLVLANGLFDLIHVGHARYLEDARRAGSTLVVALNDDASAAIHKGPTRPIVPLHERQELVAAFRCVDFVTAFSETTVAQTLRELRPRFHAKGTDYRPESLPADERALHAKLGIEVVIVGDPKEHATTDIIRRLLREEPGR